MLAEMEGNRVKVEKLKPYFSFRKDEFGGQVWVEPKDAPQYVNVSHRSILSLQYDEPQSLQSNLFSQASCCNRRPFYD